MVYAGVQFRSTLEANWAATFDGWGIHAWSYEPLAVELSNGEKYLADFYLTEQRVWAEVKGPHNERIDKPRRMQREFDEIANIVLPPLVVILRAPIRERATWESASPNQDIVLRECKTCGHTVFMDAHGDWRCRMCRTFSKPILDYRSAEVGFVRAPRSGRAA
jgi:predicted RNA-binding Zn-ribbon protein involved in translation (DUF1610 family)